MSTREAFDSQNPLAIKITPDLLDRLASECGLSGDTRETVDQTIDEVIAVLKWTFAKVVSDEGQHSPASRIEPPAPMEEGGLTAYITARVADSIRPGGESY